MRKEGVQNYPGDIVTISKGERAGRRIAPLALDTQENLIIKIVIYVYSHV